MYINVAADVTCSAELMASAPLTENFEGIDFNPFSMSKSRSCSAYIMSNPEHHVMTTIASRQGRNANFPATAMYAPTGAIASDSPRTICANEVKRLQ